jgi:LysM repeat protein
MKQFGIILGVAAVATLAGCKNPDYVSNRGAGRNSVRTVPAEQDAKKETPVAVVDKSCSCAPGTRHTKPCACGAVDCRCEVAVPAPAPVVVPAEPEYTVYIVQNGDYLAKISKRHNVTIASILKLNPSIKKNVIRVGQKIKLPGKVEVGVQRAPAKVKAPAKKKAAKPHVSYSGATKEYVVKSGDSLGAIAYSNGITIRQLKELNSLKSDRINVGQKLKVPSGKSVKPAAVAKKQESAPEVKPAAQEKPAVQEKPESKPAEPVETPAAETGSSEVKTDAAEAPAAEAAAADGSASGTAQPAASETYVVQEGDDMTGVSIRWGVSAAAIRELNNLGENDQLKPGQIIKLPAEAQQ